jgi:hypothetical protein
VVAITLNLDSGNNVTTCHTGSKSLICIEVVQLMVPSFWVEECSFIRIVESSMETDKALNLFGVDAEPIRRGRPKTGLDSLVKSARKNQR